MKKFAYFVGSPLLQKGLMDAIGKVGYETKLFNINEVGDITNYEKIYNYIMENMEAYRPDYIVVAGYHEDLAAGVIDASKKFGATFIYWAIEDPVGFERMLWLAKGADVVFTTSVECISRYRRSGINAHLLLFACNPEYHTIGKYNQSLDLDFAVQANWYNWLNRVSGYHTLLKPLLKMNLTYKIWGSYWDAGIGRQFLEDHGDLGNYLGPLPNTELPALCASAKMVLGFQCDGSSITQTSMRNYEVLSCGGFYLCHYTPASENLFVEGQHLELVRNEEEATEKAKFYLKNETERKRIANKGHEFVRKYHTYERRVFENLLPFI